MIDLDSSCVVDTENPWPGLQSFTERAQEFFHGRDEEIDELLRRTKTHPLTVLFGQSGLGKTSLLRAGLFPRLRREAFVPIYLRPTFAAGAPHPWAQVETGTARQVAEAKLDATNPLEQEASLWTWLHRRDGDICDLRGNEVILVFVFDQFEELFTLGRAKRGDEIAAFVVALGDLVENRVPAALEAALETDPEQAARFDFRRISYRVLLSLREDFLPDLEQLRSVMPSVMQNRMRLGRMTGSTALTAVVQSGGTLVTREVAEAIVRFVAGSASESLERVEVEPPLLSLVCNELNEQRRTAGEAQITATMVAGSRDVILQRFYDECLARQSAAVRAFVEDELVTDSGFRESMAVERARKLVARRGAPPEAIDQLVQSRLLRVEERLGVARVELTHDILAPIVCASRAERRTREEKQELEQRQRDAEALAERNRRQLQAARRRMVVLLILFIAATIGAGVATFAMFEARAQRRLAAKQRDVIAQSRRSFYGAQAALSFDAWEKGNIGKARQLLEESGTAGTLDPSAADLRGWEWYYVRGLCELTDVGNLSIKGSEAPIYGLAIVPGDGVDFIASAAEDGEVSLYDIRTGEKRQSWKRGDAGDVGSLAASPDGKYLAYGGLDSRVIAWEVGSGMITADVRVGGFVSGLAFSPDGRVIAASRFDDRDVVIVDRNGAKPLRRLSTGKDKVGGFAFSPDGSRMVVVTQDGVGLIWDLSKDVRSGTFTIKDVGDRKVSQVAFSPDGRWIAAMVSGYVRLIDAAAPGTQRLLSENQKYAATTFAFNHDGHYVATTGEDGPVYVWNADKGKQELVLRGHSAYAAAVTFGPRDQTLVSAGYDATIRVWDLHQRPPSRFRDVRTREVTIKGLALSGDGRFIAATNPFARPPVVSVLDAATGEELRRIPGHVSRINFAPDARTLPIPAEPGGVDLVDVATGTVVRSMPGPKGVALTARFSPDGRTVAVAYDDGDAPLGVHVWDVASGQARAIPGTDWSTAAEFSPDGRTLAIASPVDEEIQLIDVDTGKKRGSIATKLSSFVRYSPDGARLITGGIGGVVEVWRASDRTLEGKLLGHTSSLLDAIFVHGGNRLISASADRSIRYWDVDAKRELFVMDDSAKTQALAIAPDESRFVSGGWNRLALWDAAVLALHPDSPTAALSRVRGSYLFDLRQWRPAADALTQAADLGERDATVLARRGNAYAHLGEWQLALNDLGEAARLDPANQDFQHRLGLTGLRLGRTELYESARAALMELAAKTPTPFLVNSAVWLTSLVPHEPGSVDKEIAMQRQAVREEPTKYYMTSTLGTILAQGGDPDEGVEVLKAAIALAPDKGDGSAFEWISLAIAHARAGRIDEAKKWLAKSRIQRDKMASDPFFEDPNWSWDDWTDILELELLQQDAAKLIEEAVREPNAVGH